MISLSFLARFVRVGTLGWEWMSVQGALVRSMTHCFPVTWPTHPLNYPKDGRSAGCNNAKGTWAMDLEKEILVALEPAVW